MASVQAHASNSMLASTDLHMNMGAMPSAEQMVERRQVEDWFAKFLRRVVSNTAGPKETLLGGDNAQIASFSVSCRNSDWLLPPRRGRSTMSSGLGQAQGSRPELLGTRSQWVGIGCQNRRKGWKSGLFCAN